MTNPMLAELDEVVRLSEMATPGRVELWTSCSWRRLMTPDGRPFLVPIVASDGHPDMDTIDNAAFVASLVNWFRTHHATLADMAKRLEAAERKVSRLTAMRNEWERDAREHLMTFGQHLPASVECLVERFDAAIDATQEGEG